MINKTINKTINKITKLTFSLSFSVFLLTAATSIFAKDLSKIYEIDTPQGTAQTNGDQQGTSGVNAEATAKSVALANVSIISKNDEQYVKREKKRL